MPIMDNRLNNFDTAIRELAFEARRLAYVGHYDKEHELLALSEALLKLPDQFKRNSPSPNIL